MNINNQNYTVIEVYDLSVTVPDSFVINDNKTCGGHGEAKLYMGSKLHMRNFYAENEEGFKKKCVLLKKDIIQYMNTTYHEYRYPSIHYRGMEGHANMLHLWKERLKKIKELPDVIYFNIKDQKQIKGERGYVKTTSNALTGGYGLIRSIALPFISYISVMKLQNDNTGEIIFYWKLFTDFTRMAEQQYAAKHYGQGSNTTKKDIRIGQDIYRQKLYNEFTCCPFTKIDDIKLLVASHIKPWSVCNQTEKTDVENGFILSPLFDKLFDRGYITFDENGDLEISDWLSPANQQRIDFTYNKNDLHLTDKRKSFLEYHRNNVFK